MDEIDLKRFDMSKVKPDSMCCFVAARRSGKCLAQGTEVMMFDGTLKKVEDINQGDLVMGDDSTPRTVLNTTSGIDEMYEIENKKGITYTVNSHHILSLRQTAKKSLGYCERERRNPYYSVRWFDKTTFNMTSKYFSCPKGCDKQKILETATQFYESIVDDLIVDIPFKAFMSLSKPKQDSLLGYQVPINFSHCDVEIDPYILGYWLGDGTSRNTDITTQDSAVLHYLSQKLTDYGLCLEYKTRYRYKISTGIYGQKNNIFKQFLEKNNLISNKHVPRNYMVNSRENRLKLLAGFIDADGHYDGSDFEISQCVKHEKLTDDIVFIAKSLGFSAYKQKTSWFHINGEGIEEIPTVCPRKMARQHAPRVSALVSRIKVIPKGIGQYHGFELDGNHRFVLGNFIVSHNSILVRDLLSHNRGIPAGIVMSKTDKLTHFYDRFIPPVLIYDDYKPEILDRLFERQKKALEENWPNPYCFAILDDILSSGEVWKKDERIKEIFYNGRHYKIMCLLTLQHTGGIPPGLRSNIDYTFILRNTNARARKDLYENYAGVFPTREIFERVLEVTTENYGCLVIDNTTQSSKLEDQVFYYKANIDSPPFKMCSNSFWSREKKVTPRDNQGTSSVLRNKRKLVIRKT